MNPEQNGASAPPRRLLLGNALTALALPALAQDFPSRAVTLVVPFPPGGTLDTLARLVAERLRGLLGQPVVVESRAGAGGHVGGAFVARAQPDGHTLLVAPQLSFNADLLYTGLPYDPRALEPVSVLTSYPNVLAARRDFGPSTVPELLEAARAAPEQLTYGSQGNGQIAHLTFEMLRSMTGARLTHVPYRGSAPMVTALLGREVDLGADNLITMGEHLRAGTMKLIAITGAKRVPAHPTVPTVAETVPGFVSDTWTAVGAPRSTPIGVRRHLAAAIGQAVRSPEFLERLVDAQAEPLGNTPEQMAEMIRESRARWEPVIRTGNIRVE
jgi:tripartite-type tricarboxylate transporter receptor subunit TctC